MHPKTIKHLAYILAVMFILAACGGPAAPAPQVDTQATAQSMAATAIAETLVHEMASAETATEIPTNTPLPPSETPTLAPPTETPTITPTFTPEFTPTWTPWPTPDPNGLRVFFFKLDDSGKPNCNATLVSFNTGITPTGNIPLDLQAAVGYLISIRYEYFWELYNPLYESNLTITGVTYQDDSWRVDLVGTLIRSSSNCNWRQIRDQMMQTVQAVPDAEKPDVWLNNKPFVDFGP